MIIATLAVLGLIMGSFLDAMVWRMHEGNDFVRSRSRCDHCAHVLAARDLVPLVSWLASRGRCRYCKAKISWQHPLIELVTATVFATSYAWWPFETGDIYGKALLIGWLVACVGMIALAVYDLKWMLLPSRIIYPTFFVALVAQITYIIGKEPRPWHAAELLAGSLLVASGFFWLLFMISRGRWIGFGDVRLGFITGTFLATPTRSFLMIFFASVAGTILAVPLLSTQGKSLRTRLPYGPFLLAATMVVMLFGQSIIDWYDRVLLG
ncbi:MAG TPA: prepilin peptidase [Candidatus Saccharimonadales bacterium]|nr:prepilin peptidase [Candidatus Saccharimonadales bacterium]